MRVEVTQHHIEAGKASDSFACPIALALQELMPEVGGWEVDGVLAVTYNYRMALPRIARNFIQAFDFGHLVIPFDFDAEPVDLEVDY
jgi:hypothetical protein